MSILIAGNFKLNLYNCILKTVIEKIIINNKQIKSYKFIELSDIYTFTEFEQYNSLFIIGVIELSHKLFHHLKIIKHKNNLQIIGLNLKIINDVEDIDQIFNYVYFNNKKNTEDHLPFVKCEKVSDMIFLVKSINFLRKKCFSSHIGIILSKEHYDMLEPELKEKFIENMIQIIKCCVGYNIKVHLYGLNLLSKSNDNELVYNIYNKIHGNSLNSIVLYSTVDNAISSLNKIDWFITTNNESFNIPCALKKNQIFVKLSDHSPIHQNNNTTDMLCNIDTMLNKLELLISNNRHINIDTYRQSKISNSVLYKKIITNLTRIINV